MLHSALRDNKSVAVPRGFSGLTCMLIFTPLHETNTQALRLFISLLESRSILELKFQFSLVVRCDGEVITFPARFRCHPIKL